MPVAIASVLLTGPYGAPLVAACMAITAQRNRWYRQCSTQAWLRSRAGSAAEAYLRRRWGCSTTPGLQVELRQRPAARAWWRSLVSRSRQRVSAGHRRRPVGAGVPDPCLVRDARRVGVPVVHLLDLRAAARRGLVLRRGPSRPCWCSPRSWWRAGSSPSSRCARRPTRRPCARSSSRSRPRTSTPVATPSASRGPRSSSAGAPACARTGWPASATPACCTTSASSASRRTSCRRPAGSPTTSTRRSSSTRCAVARSSRTSSSSARRSRGSCCTTSASTAAATRWAGSARRSRSSPGSSRWPTPSTR